MRTVLVTGSASGLGAAVTTALRDREHRVVGLDVREADVVADLASVDGRESAVARVLDLCHGTLGGVVSCAGLGPYEEPEPIISVNYFGAIAMLDRFRDALERGEAPAAVAISSVGAAFHQIVPVGVLDACHAGDEKHARELLASTNGNTAYVSAKRALAQAVRRRAGEWGDRGIRLNTVAPGKMETPMLDALLADAASAPAINGMPVPLGRSAPAAEIAKAVIYLLGPDASYVHGQTLFVDGGSEAVVRPDEV
jgi:NAD(P)-dependent dehydrogenase (short-subunit alcohol dehydrogenase family)